MAHEAPKLLDICYCIPNYSNINIVFYWRAGVKKKNYIMFVWICWSKGLLSNKCGWSKMFMNTTLNETKAFLEDRFCGPKDSQVALLTVTQSDSGHKETLTIRLWATVILTPYRSGLNSEGHSFYHLQDWAKGSSLWSVVHSFGQLFAYVTSETTLAKKGNNYYITTTKWLQQIRYCMYTKKIDMLPLSD